MEGLRHFDEGLVVSHEDILAMIALKKAQARPKE
jgi:predicted transcriptional regulator